MIEYWEFLNAKKAFKEIREFDLTNMINSMDEEIENGVFVAIK